MSSAAQAPQLKPKAYRPSEAARPSLINTLRILTNVALPARRQSVPYSSQNR